MVIHDYSPSYWRDRGRRILEPWRLRLGPAWTTQPYSVSKKKIEKTKTRKPRLCWKMQFTGGEGNMF